MVGCCSDESLFEWDAEIEALEVTWNSEKPNSYFLPAAGQALTEKDSFAFTFQLTLDEVKAGHLDGQPYTFEVSIGLLNLENARRRDSSVAPEQIREPCWSGTISRTPVLGPRFRQR